jgi:hypothetical protein
MVAKTVEKAYLKVGLLDVYLVETMDGWMEKLKDELREKLLAAKKVCLWVAQWAKWKEFY